MSEQDSARRLQRATFRTPRELDFFSENALRSQTGFERARWPLAVVKELVDNALDAAEEAGIAPADREQGEVICW